MLPLVPCKRLAESEDDSDEIWEEVTDPTTQEHSEIQLTQPEIILVKSKKRSGITKEEKLKRTRLHQVHLVSLLAAAITRNKWCNDSDIQGICYSMISKQISSNRLFNHSIKTFVSYWRNIFRLENVDKANAIDSISYLSKCLSDRCINTRNNYNIVFAAACRSMQLNTRLMACLFPISLSFTLDDTNDFSLQIWLEVWNDFHGVWIPVDAAENIVDEPLKIVKFGQTRKSWGMYVLAFDSSKYD